MISVQVIYEECDVRPLLQLIRAAMASNEYSHVPLTHDGIQLLVDIIEDRIYPKAVTDQHSDHQPGPGIAPQ